MIPLHKTKHTYMKISVFPACLSLILTAALTYLVFNIAQTDNNCILLTIGTAISVLSTLAMAMSVKFENSRVGASIKALAIVCFFIMLIVNLCFAWLGVNVPYYVILLALLFVVYLFVVWKLYEMKNI